MSEYIKLYLDENFETVMQSVENEEGEPLTFNLRIDKEEKKKKPIWAKTEEGYIVEGDDEDYPNGTEISIKKIGDEDNTNKFRLSDKEDPDPENDDDWSNWGDMIEIGTVDEDGIKFWVQAKAEGDEEVKKDESTGIEIAGIAKAV